MSVKNLTCLTWKDILSEKGFEDSIVNSFIGFISWDKEKIYSKLGEEINDVLAGYEGKIIAMDVACSKYNSIGILFFKMIISEKNANNIFETILKYEHNEVYST